MAPALATALAAALAMLGAAAGAHDFHMGIADISFNAQTGSTEIVHTYTAHDVEGLLSNLYQRQFDLSREEDERVFRRYVEKQFYLEAPDHARLPLHWVGLKADADSIVVFQEIEHTRLAPATMIHDGLLIDFLPDQKNTVNVQTSTAMQTLVFGADSIEQTAR
ncbi:MAG TPA: DUF6702 family protein [Janthinobacterium sp.]|nr:DUF6702 family protein [Janthinobacterium sp.]